MINVEAILHRFAPTGDRSCKFQFQTTREAAEELYTELGRKYLKVCRVVCVSDDDVQANVEEVAKEPVAPPAPKVEEGKKSPSKRLRDVIFREYEQKFKDGNWRTGFKKDSEAYYTERMEEIINEVKRGLEPPFIGE